MKPIIFLVSILLSIPFSTQLETQIFTITTTTPRVSTQLDSETHTMIIPGKDALLMEMYHLDSISSESSPKSLLRQRLQRDIFRTNSLSAKAGKKVGSLNSTVYSGESQGSGEYFTHLGFGRPQQLMQVILDTGSDNIWIQCQPCKRCYKQTDPLFDPTASNSSSFVHCGSRRCPTNTTCPQNKKRCPYEISYGDRSHSSGDYMTETLTFQGRQVDNILLGCGHDNVGLFVGAAGLLGLGWGNKSFVGQAGRRFGNIFSYCLVDLDSPDKSLLLFGPTAAPSRNTVYTPLIRNPDSTTFYYVALEGISVGGERVNLPNGVFDQDKNGTGGGVIIDSGTSVTRLARPAYIAMRDAFRNRTTHLNRTSGGFSILDTCYDLSGSPAVPTLVLHFKGADMNLRASNYLVQIDGNGMFCFAFAGTTDGLSIIGNIQQAGFRVSFDLNKERLGFTPGSC